MFNLHSEINRQQALDNMMTYAVPSLTAILQLVQDKDDTRPAAIMFYPVLDAFDSKAVVGSVSLVFYWSNFLASLLPGYIKGMVCVLSASTDQVYTYTISGDEVKLMGEGDLHDPNYDEYQKVVEARLLLEGMDDAGKFITYTLIMYPSEEFEDQYKTSKDIVYAIGAVLIFLFTAGLFLLYDHLVEDRQQKTSRLATQVRIRVFSRNYFYIPFTWNVDLYLFFVSIQAREHRRRYVPRRLPRSSVQGTREHCSTAEFVAG